MMYNKNFLIKMHGQEVVDIQETDTEIDNVNTVNDTWAYYHENDGGKIYCEKIKYCVESKQGENYEHEVRISFYAKVPLEGFDFNFPMIFGGVNLKDFSRRIADRYIPGSWCTPEQKAYNAAMAENYWNNRD